MQQSNAGHSGVFLTPKGHSLASGGNVATVCAKSTFERPLSCVSDSDAGDLDLLPAYSHCLVVRRGKAVFDQVSYHIDVEPVGEQSCPGAAAQPCVGKQFERPPLFCAKVNPRQTNAPPASEFSGRSYMPPYGVQSGLLQTASNTPSARRTSRIMAKHCHAHEQCENRFCFVVSQFVASKRAFS